MNKERFIAANVMAIVTHGIVSYFVLRELV
jgi:hypothetical protein